jgi:hypothetical protein
MSRKSDNAEERRAQADRVLTRADRQDPDRRHRDQRPAERRKTERRAASPQTGARKPAGAKRKTTNRKK